jgi:hypothetical protein
VQGVLSLADVFQRAGKGVSRGSDGRGTDATVNGAAKSLDVKGKGRDEVGGSRKCRERRSSKSSKKTSKGWDNVIDAGLLEEEHVQALFDW